MDLDYIAIGRRIKIARIKAGWSQQRLADSAKLSLQYLSNIENGHKSPSLQILVSIANALSLSVDAFLCDNIVHSKHIFEQEIQDCVADCDDYEIRVLAEVIQTTKKALRSANALYRKSNS